MKLINFRIQNYKSIIDTGCCLTSPITILAGKNESGKTTVLEALVNFNVNIKITEDKFPIEKAGVQPSITMEFEISNEEFKTSTLKKFFKNDFKSPYLIEITKTPPENYDFSEETKKNLKNFDDFDKEHIIENLKKKLNDFGAIYEATFGESQQTLKEMMSKKFEDFEKIIEHIKELLENHGITEDEGVYKDFKKIEKILSLWQSFRTSKKSFWQNIKNILPNFIFFDSFENMFPDKLSIKNLDKSELANDVSKATNLDLQIFKGDDSITKENLKDKIQLTINEDYNDFWTQDFAKLHFSFDKENIFFWIKENKITYKPSQRSKGRQWHLSFYIKIASGTSKGNENIILIDEPGLFLHAEAQKSILKKLEILSKKTNIIFSTHSSYLLEFENLDRIKLVTKTNKEGTIIQNEIHKVQDKETLTPILSAIGLKINSSIEGISKTKNVIVEGITDYLYLEAFKTILNKKEENISFISTSGSGTMPLVGTIIHGWGGKVIYLFDKDQGGKDGEKNLKKNWKIKEESMLYISESNDISCIEQLFSKEDFKKYCDKEEVFDKKNKYKYALSFFKLRKDKNTVLSNETTKNVTVLFNRINKALST